MIDPAGVMIEARRKAGLTQLAVAELSGYSQSYVSQVERGAVTPNIFVLTDLIRACGFRLKVSLVRQRGAR